MTEEKEKILITGGAGFIGSHLIDRLLKEGKEVYAVDIFKLNLSQQINIGKERDAWNDKQIKIGNIRHNIDNPNFHFFECDIRDKKEMEKIIHENKIQKIVHLAAKTGVRESINNPSEYADVNIKGTINLLEICKNANIESFVFASSSSIYGTNKKIPFNENDSTNNIISPYAMTKKCGEMFCYLYNRLYSIPVCCLRFFTVYGSRQRSDMAICKFTQAIHDGKNIEMFGDGSSERDYTHITDIIDAISNVLDKKFNFEIFNLGSSKTVTLNYLVALIEGELEKKANIVQLPMQQGDVPITVADISKARRMLSYNPKVQIEDGIKEYVEWYKKVI